MKNHVEDFVEAMNARIDVPFLTDMSELKYRLSETGLSNFVGTTQQIQTNFMSGQLTIGQQNRYYESWEGKFFTSDSVILNHPIRINHRSFSLVFFQSPVPIKLRVNHQCFHEITIDSEGKEGVVFLSSLTNLSIMIPQDTLIQFKVVSIRNLYLESHWMRLFPYRKIVEGRMPFFYFWPQRIAFHEKAMLNHVEVFLPNAYHSPIKMLEDLFQFAGSLTRDSKQLGLWQTYYLLSAEALLRNTFSESPPELGSIISQSKLTPFVFFIRFKQLFGLGIEQYHEYARKEQMKALLIDLRFPVDEISQLFELAFSKRDT